MVGTKVSITSPAPNTTRFGVRGVLHRPDAQVVFVDTPGLHRPRTPLGRRLNETATLAFADVDVLVAVVDATALIGPGDRLVLGRALGAAAGEASPALFVVVNKVDRARREQVVERLASAAATVERLAGEAGRASLAEDVDYF